MRQGHTVVVLLDKAGVESLSFWQSKVASEVQVANTSRTAVLRAVLRYAVMRVEEIVVERGEMAAADCLLEAAPKIDLSRCAVRLPVDLVEKVVERSRAFFADAWIERDAMSKTMSFYASFGMQALRSEQNDDVLEFFEWVLGQMICGRPRVRDVIDVPETTRIKVWREQRLRRLRVS